MMIRSIAQLTLFFYSLLFTSMMRIVFYQVLVCKYQCLPCRKTDQNDPGIEYMAITLFQNEAKELRPC